MKNINRLILSALLLASCSRIHIIRPVDPLSRGERLKLAFIYEAKGEVDLALNEYRGALAGDEKDAGLYFSIGNIHIRMNRFKDALENYLKAVKLDPLNGDYHNNLSWAYMETGEIEKAEAAAKEALRADPRKGFVYLDTLGMAQMKGNKLKEAEGSFLGAIAAAPEAEKEGRKEIYAHLLDLYRKNGDREKALEAEGRLKGIK